MKRMFSMTLLFTVLISSGGPINAAQKSEQESTSSAATAQKDSKSTKGGLDTIKPGDIPPVTPSPEPTTAGAIRGKPATPTIGDKSAAPPTDDPNPPGSGASTPPSGGGGTNPAPPIFADIVGRVMPLRYCYVGEACWVPMQFINVGQSVPAEVPIPDPTWTRDGSAYSPHPANIKHASKSPGWLSQGVQTWNAPLWNGASPENEGNHEVRAALPRLATEKEAGNNVAVAQVKIGYSDAAVKLVRKYVQNSTKYEIRAEVENKGQLPTKKIRVKAATSNAGPIPARRSTENSDASSETHYVDSLAPGEKKRWTIGYTPSVAETMWAYAIVECAKGDSNYHSNCGDQPLDNNTDKRTFTPIN